uniref:Chromosome partition protein Smc n=1 Tax=Candidatus Methanophaga sp. ANME-1 ERB7 TaxID=2759913 RepID=A0A7G9ZDF9_9EURY|nr:chromosome partition protein Smc [Methanosarcinales archaeon ANME-1 ERB7]
MVKDKIRKPGRKALFEDVEENREKEVGGREEGEKVSNGETEEEYRERQLRRLLKTMDAFKNGDFTIRLPKERYDIYGELAETYNKMAEMTGGVTTEMSRVAKVAGTEGKLTEHASVPGVAGSWKDVVDTLNGLIDAVSKFTLEMRRILDNISWGNLTEKFAIPVAGDFKVMSDTVNKTVDRFNLIGGEVSRVTREVGVEGKLGAQGEVPGVAGAWKELTDNVNTLAANVTDQMRDIAKVSTAIADGDLTQKITVDVKGEILQLKDNINGMVDRLNLIGGEVSRVTREVGVEGKLGAQGEVPGVAGAWKELTDNVNTLAANVTDQMRDIAKVSTAIADGDLTQKITVDVKGEILQLKDNINGMVDRLNLIGGEVSRVTREVGVEGKLGAQGEVPGVAGAWKELTDNVNTLAANVTDQMRDIAKVSTAIADGDLTQKITVDVKGEILQLKDNINGMVDRLNLIGSEVSRVTRDVGVEGKLGAQGEVPGVAGAWKELTDNVNTLAANVTDQMRDIAKVSTAIADGDLTQKITVDVKGEILQLKDNINGMVDRLNLIGSEVSRVTRDVGVEGRLGAQGEVPGVAGAWKELTDTVNTLAANVTDQMRDIAKVSTAIADGDLTQKITVDVKGEILQLKDNINGMVDRLNLIGSEVSRVTRDVGVEGRLGAQGEVPGVAGAWKELTDTVNTLAANVTDQMRDIAKVSTAIADGDLTQKITVDVKGEILQLKDNINGMVDRLNLIGSEVSRVTREVGVEGKLGAQGEVPGVAGAWKELTDTVNTLAANVTDQMRDIAKVSTAIADGDLTQKITVDVKGEILQLKDNINGMVDRLNLIGSEVARVAREVGVEGKLGTQGEVPGVAGAWKELTDNVNMLAANLTNQVRDIAKVATALADGDLTQKITVESKGELLQLKDTINGMVDKLNLIGGEVSRVTREVGVEGKLGAQGEVSGIAGAWKELTDNVNMLSANLRIQVRDIAKVATALADGDLTQKVTVDAKGDILQLKETINRMVEKVNLIGGEVSRVTREVGVEGKLGAQGEVPGIAGTWKELTDNVNMLSANLKNQVGDIAKVATALADGDLTQKVTVDAKGDIQKLKETINRMVEKVNLIGGEVSRVTREVGVEGKLGAQGEVSGIAGTWKELTDNVNLLSANLKNQVGDIAKVATALANGDLTQKVTVDAKGDILLLKENINGMVDRLNVLVARVRDSANTVASSAQGIAASGTEMSTSTTQVAASVEQIAKGAQDQAEKTDSASGAVEQISKAAIEVADRGDEVNKAASAANKSAQAGLRTVDTVVKSMQGISDVAEKTSTTVETMAQRGEEIAMTLGVITDIASQTNLLALNAAIEAARAGEAGRGFAVVAEEIRKLAENSRKSAGEIAELVKSIQEETVSASEAAKTMTESVTGGREATDKSAAALDDISFTMKQTSNVALAISDAAAQQKTSIESVVKMVEGISTIAEETAAGSEESSASAHELTSAMEDLTTSGQELVRTAAELQDAVARFKLSGETEEFKAAKKSV